MAYVGGGGFGGGPPSHPVRWTADMAAVLMKPGDTKTAYATGTASSPHATDSRLTVTVAAPVAPSTDSVVTLHAAPGTEVFTTAWGFTDSTGAVTGPSVNVDPGN